MTGTVGARLQAGLQPVGRDAELARLRTFLTDPTGPVVLHLHGPGGVGKSTLLAAADRVAGEEGRPTRRLDLGTLDPGRGLPSDALPDAPPENLVLLLDRVEASPTLLTWVLRDLVPGLPEACRVVLAGRSP